MSPSLLTTSSSRRPAHARHVIHQWDADPDATATLLNEIRESFKGVPHRGVRLHETEVIDNYGLHDARRAARLKDTDRNWQEVRDEWIEEFGGIGGLSFLDGPAFRYYLPAYMSYWLRTGTEPNNLSFHLRPDGFRDFENLFRPKELRTIARFLRYVQLNYGWSFRDGKASDALTEYWGRYLDGPDHA